MTTLLVVAKAPVRGLVKTRLAGDLGGRHDLAAEVAAAALLDTLAACREAGGACRLALAGSLDHAVRRDDLIDALDGWTVVPQSSGSLGDRLAHALAGVAGPVLQIGMDTPQVTTALLSSAAGLLDEHDAVLGPADDGGWWALGLRDGSAGAALREVVMSTPTTYDDTRAALETAGLTPVTAPVLTDVDRLGDLHRVVAAAPWTRLARLVTDRPALRPAGALG